MEIKEIFEQSIDLKTKMLHDENMILNIEYIAKSIVEALKNKGKILIFGNGGSASDSLHFAGELVGRFEKNRRPYFAVSLNSDVATMTAIANDYGYEHIFARQVEGLCNQNDVVIGISTSGNSKNVVRGIEKANTIGAKTICFLGSDGGILKSLSKNSIVVPSNVTARIQEIHILIIHIICKLVEEELK